MTEPEWVACTDPDQMLTFLRQTGRASERKLRLFAVACCRGVWPLLTDERSKWAVEVAERYADERATKEELLRAGVRAFSVEIYLDAGCVTVAEGWRAATETAATVSDAVYSTAYERAGGPQALSSWMVERAAQAALLRDSFGHLPFRPVVVAPAVLTWHERLVVRLAKQIYDERSWEGMPLLADALLDAGAEDDELVAHLRSPGPHTRGCFALDLLLGRP